MRVLYVEDNPANVFLVKRVAKMGKHEIINYIDGGQALKKFDDINPDLVLMDIQLAGDIGGLDVVRELRGRGIDVPIIAVTAYAMVGDKERCLAAGCNDYLAKPLPVPRLVQIFQEYSDKVINKASKAKDDLTEPTHDVKPELATPSKEDAVATEDKESNTEKEAETQTVAAENSTTEASEEGKQETSSIVETSEPVKKTDEENKQKTSEPVQETKPVENTDTTDTKVESSTEASEKKPTGKLSDEDTLPVKEDTETDTQKSTSEPSSNT